MMSEEDLYLKKVDVFNNIVTDYVLSLSNFFEIAQVAGDRSASLAEVWFTCPLCTVKNGVEVMYLLQRDKVTDAVVMQSLSTFFDIDEGGEEVIYSGVESIFTIGDSEVVMICKQCVMDYGYDPDSVEVIETQFKDKVI